MQERKKGEFMGKCDGIEYNATVAVGLHGSRWWVAENNWEQAVVTYDFLWANLKNKEVPDGKKFCAFDGNPCKPGDKCLPTSVTVTVISGKAELKEVTTQVGNETYHSFLLVVKEQATVTVKTTCACITPPNH
jgi:hypothetical protein